MARDEVRPARNVRSPHRGGGEQPASGHRISGVYLLRAGASPGGGELRLYDTWHTEGRRVDAASYTSLRPIDNSMVFWPRGAPHEFFPEPTQADGNIAISFTFWEDRTTDRVHDSQVCAKGVVETPLDGGANVPLAPSSME